MKKIIFYLSSIAAAVYFILVLKILVFDFNNLNSYGFGHLTGTIVLLVLFLSASFLSGKEVWKKYLSK